jgi:hypothetical protein
MEVMHVRQRCRVALRGNAEQEDDKAEIRRHDIYSLENPLTKTR